MSGTVQLRWRRRGVVVGVAGVVTWLVPLSHADTPTTAPVAAATTQPATIASTTQPSDVARLLQRINDAYAKLRFAEFDGQVTGTFDVAEQGQRHTELFTSTYAAPNRFRHEAKNDILLGSTGQTAYAFEPRRNVYLQTDAPKDRASAGDWPAPLASVLQRQNPSMLLALTSGSSAGNNLADLADDMKRLPDTLLQGVACPTLQFNVPGQGLISLMIDPQTALLRQMRVDLRDVLEQRGTADVRQAMVTVDYQPVNTTAPAEVSDALFAWSPPHDAAPAGAAAPTPMQSSGPGDAAKALVGKPAPAFSLPNLNDQQVSLAKQKGSVVVLDFWATWCGPCVASLPHLDDLYKSKASTGLKVFASDLQEDKPTVKSFVDKKGWTFPVLLDNGDVAQKYGADAIPETVVIGRDGTVQAVFVGSGNEDAIRDAVEKALAK